MMVANLIHSGCLIYIVVEHVQWRVCVVHSDGMSSSSSSGGSSISSTQKRTNSGVIGRLETFQRRGPLCKMNDS